MAPTSEQSEIYHKSGFWYTESKSMLLWSVVCLKYFFHFIRTNFAAMWHIYFNMPLIAAIYHILLQYYVTYCCNMSHFAAICHVAVDMLHIVALCHIAVDMSNCSKNCPFQNEKNILDKRCPISLFKRASRQVCSNAQVDHLTSYLRHSVKTKAITCNTSFASHFFSC